MTSPSPALRKRIIGLPRSSSRNQRQFAHLKMLERVRPLGAPICFEGKLYPPGANIRAEDLPEHPVILECAGKVGPGQHRKLREVLWILWVYDWGREEWKEIARAQSAGSEWILALREPAQRALHPDRELQDVTKQWQSTTQAIMEWVDRTLEMEAPEVKLHVLASVYDQVAGRIAQELAA